MVLLRSRNLHTCRTIQCNVFMFVRSKNQNPIKFLITVQPSDVITVPSPVCLRIQQSQEQRGQALFDVSV